MSALFFVSYLLKSETMKIEVKKLDKDAKLPQFAHPGDAGMDLFSNENLVINPNERKNVASGIAVKIPHGYVGLIWDKSGMAWNGGIKTMGGVIDSGYRGEIGVVLANLSDKKYEIKKGDKIAQMLIQKIETPEIMEVNELDNTSRGEGRFGSTGKH